MSRCAEGGSRLDGRCPRDTGAQLRRSWGEPHCVGAKSGDEDSWCNKDASVLAPRTRASRTTERKTRYLLYSCALRVDCGLRDSRCWLRVRPSNSCGAMLVPGQMGGEVHAIFASFVGPSPQRGDLARHLRRRPGLRERRRDLRRTRHRGPLLPPKLTASPRVALWRRGSHGRGRGSGAAVFRATQVGISAGRERPGGSICGCVLAIPGSSQCGARLGSPLAPHLPSHSSCPRRRLLAGGVDTTPLGRRRRGRARPG